MSINEQKMFEVDYDLAQSNKVCNTAIAWAQVPSEPSADERDALRARLVGDNVTIQIVENVTASQKSSSTVDRTSEVSAGVTALPFTSKTFTDKLGVGANSGNAFSGKGGTESANTFTGSITAYGVARPVRPTPTRISSSLVYTSSGGYL